MSNYITNAAVHDQTEITSIEAVLLKSQLRWARACLQNGVHRLPKIALNDELSNGHRDKGAPKKYYEDSLKKTLGNCHTDHHQRSTLTGDHTVHQVASTFEDFRRANLKEKCHRRKIRGASASIPDQNPNCSRCSRTWLSCIGAVGHQWACCRRGQPPS